MPDDRTHWESLSQALGDVALVAAAVEWSVELIVWGLVGDADAGMALTGRGNFGRNCELAERLTKAVVEDEGAVDRIMVAIRQAKKAVEQRNAILHDIWLARGGAEGDIVKILRSFTGGKLTVETEARTLDDLRDAQDALIAVMTSVASCMREVTRAGKARRKAVPSLRLPDT